MAWNVIKAGKLTAATEPSTSQIALQKRKMEKGHVATATWAGFSPTQQAAIEAEALKQFTAGSGDLALWVKVLKAGKVARKISPKTQLIGQLLVANSILTQAQWDAAFKA